MSQFFEIHPSHPQQRLLKRAAEICASGGLVVYPTDTTYALGCHIGDKSATDRIRGVRRLERNHHFTLLCRDLSEIATYAQVENDAYRALKRYTPGPYTFLLKASREVPRRLVHEKRRTIGIRVPDNAIARGLLDVLGEPMMTTTMRMPNADAPLTDPAVIREVLEHQVDVVIDGGHCGVLPTTVVDLASDEPRLVREGAGEFPLPV